jgi:hypothetical protein
MMGTFVIQRQEDGANLGALYRCRMDCGTWADVAPSLATVHQQTQFSDFSIFSFLHIFFSIFLYKIGVYNPDLAYTIKPKTLQTFNPTLNKDHIFSL